MDKKRWQGIRKKAWHILRKHFGAKFGVEASHPQGDKDPSVFAPHLNFLWRQESGRRPFLDVQLLRKLWGTVLGVQTVDVYSQYSPRFSQIIHWVKYVTRTFPGTHKWTGSLRWYGKYPKARPIEHCRCADCNSRFQVIGFLDAQTVDEYWERGVLLGRDPPWHRDADIQFIKRH